MERALQRFLVQERLRLQQHRQRVERVSSVCAPWQHRLMLRSELQLRVASLGRGAGSQASAK